MRATPLALTLALAACAAAPTIPRQLTITLVDRVSGSRWVGSATPKTAATGAITVDVAGLRFEGDYVMTRGGSYSLGSVVSPGGVPVSVDQVAQDTRGNGMAHASTERGAWLRCVFAWDSIGRAGLGACIADNRQSFDLAITQ